MQLTNRQARKLRPGDLLVLDEKFEDVKAGLGNQKLPKGAYFVVKEVDDDLEMKLVFFNGFFPDYPKVTEDLPPGYQFSRARFRFPTENERYEWIRRNFGPIKFVFKEQTTPEWAKTRSTFNNPLAALRGVLPDVYGHKENQQYHSKLEERKFREELNKEHNMYDALEDVEIKLVKPFVDHAAREDEQHEELRRHDQKYRGVNGGVK